LAAQLIDIICKLIVSSVYKRAPRGIKKSSSPPCSYFQNRKNILTAGCFLQERHHDVGIFPESNAGSAGELILLPAVNAYGKVGAHLGTLGATNTFFLTKQHCSSWDSFVLRHIQIQKHSRAGSRTETTPFAPGPINFNLGKHNKPLFSCNRQRIQWQRHQGALIRSELQNSDSTKRNNGGSNKGVSNSVQKYIR
jgi:hypothetical protein